MTDVELWDREAETFDEAADHGLRDPAVRAAWSQLLAEVLPHRSRVLDVGCGTGSLSVLLAEQGHVVTGIDVSAQMLQQARHKAAQHRVEARFVQADAAHPPVEPAFDVVLCRHVLWALPDPGVVLDRWLALLPGGGTLLLVEGLWGNGAGLPAAAVRELVERRVDGTVVRVLDDAALWGRMITDERYLVVGRVSAPVGSG
jgi:SAM-dependent methyltransferase